MDWQPIETAPRGDHIYIDVWRARPGRAIALGHRVPEVCWIEEPRRCWIENTNARAGWYRENDEYPMEWVDAPEWVVTHWRPMPEPPCAPPLDIDALHEDVSRRYPNILKRLAE